MDPAVVAAIAEVREAAQGMAMQLDAKWEEKFKMLEKAMEKMNGDKSKADRFNHKDAKEVKPGAWCENQPFADLALEMRTWASTLHDDFNELMDMAEKNPGSFTDDRDVDEAMYPDYKKMSKHLWNMMVITVKGDAKAYIKNPKESGFQGWAQLVQHYDPRGGADKTVAYARLVNPVYAFGQARDAGEARQLMQKWESEVAQYEKKFQTIDDEAKTLGLKSIMPKGMFGENGTFRGVAYADYMTLRKAILNYLEDKPLPGGIATSEIGNVNHKQEGSDKAECERLKDMEMKIEDALAFMRSQSYGKGRKAEQPKGTGKGGKGCYTCGGNHLARDCPQGGKGSYGPIRKGVEHSPKACYTCGKVGHLSRECRFGGGGGWQKGYGKGKGLHNIEGDIDEKSEDHESDAYLWCLSNDEAANKRDVMTNPPWDPEESNLVPIKTPISTMNRFSSLEVTEEDYEQWPELHEARMEPRTLQDTGKVMRIGKRSNKESHRMRKSSSSNISSSSISRSSSSISSSSRSSSSSRCENMMACLSEGESKTPEECIMSCRDEGFMWVKEEAAVDSGAVDCVANKKTFPHLQVTPTPESLRGECWTCAGGKQLKKEGEIVLDWITEDGQAQKVKLKVGEVSRTLISADKLLEKGNEVILSKRNPRIITRTGQTIKLRRKGGMFIMDMWYKVPVNKSTSKLAAGFTRQGS